MINGPLTSVSFSHPIKQLVNVLLCCLFYCVILFILEFICATNCNWNRVYLQITPRCSVVIWHARDVNCFVAHLSRWLFFMEWPHHLPLLSRKLELSLLPSVCAHAHFCVWERVTFCSYCEQKQLQVVSSTQSFCLPLYRDSFLLAVTLAFSPVCNCHAPLFVWSHT